MIELFGDHENFVECHKIELNENFVEDFQL